MSAASTETSFRPSADLFRAIVDRMTAPGIDHVLLGPVVHDEAGKWYFVVGCITGSDFHLDQIGSDDIRLADFARAGLLAEFVARRPIVIHDFDDEMEMAEWAAAICPCEKTARILADLRAELSA